MYKTGVHFYVNIKNLIDIIKEEADKDDDLKQAHSVRNGDIHHTEGTCD